jgi:DNA-binding transcriptional MerR regulator
MTPQIERPTGKKTPTDSRADRMETRPAPQDRHRGSPGGSPALGSPPGPAWSPFGGHPHGSVRIGYPYVKGASSPEANPSAPDETMADAQVELLKIGDFAKLAGTNLRTLRYYEELDLLIPASRSQGGFRYFRRTDLHRLNMIHDLQALSLPLERIRELMATRDEKAGRKNFIEKVHLALAEQDRLLALRITELESQRKSIAAAVAKLANCAVCKHNPGSDNNYCEPCQLTGERLPETLSALF